MFDEVVSSNGRWSIPRTRALRNDVAHRAAFTRQYAATESNDDERDYVPPESWSDKAVIYELPGLREFIPLCDSIEELEQTCKLPGGDKD
jgi:hypothetical protein